MRLPTPLPRPFREGPEARHDLTRQPPNRGLCVRINSESGSLRTAHDDRPAMLPQGWISAAPNLTNLALGTRPACLRASYLQS